MNTEERRIKVIFFDAGGVLFDTLMNKEVRIRKLMLARGFSKCLIDDAIEKANLLSEAYANENQLVTSWEEEVEYYKSYYRIIARELGKMELTEELFYFTHYAGHCYLFPEVLDVLNALNDKYRLGVISNAMPSMDWIFDKLNIRKYFESIILSSSVHQSKPNEEIYRIAVNQMQANREECIFVDDKIENVKGANMAGIKSFHLNRTEENLSSLFKKIGILS